MNKMREEFESWVVSEFDYDVSKSSNGTYHELKTFIAWQSWKASRAALCVDISKAYQQGGMMADYLVESALDEAGVSYK